ncbi:MAG: hypothetical protein M3010_01705, partial [Candidatus Dormibacteraeota bacterium]|nr:hypothetical protein [Candidatus Dormibacteraeota bacterium]
MTARYPLRIIASSAIGLVSAVAFSATAPAGSALAANSGSVPADRQAYVSDLPADPYNNDTGAIHVGVAGGRQTAHSYLHLELEA